MVCSELLHGNATDFTDVLGVGSQPPQETLLIQFRMELRAIDRAVGKAKRLIFDLFGLRQPNRAGGQFDHSILMAHLSIESVA